MVFRLSVVNAGGEFTGFFDQLLFTLQLELPSVGRIESLQTVQLPQGLAGTSTATVQRNQ